jgi:hypothetical protein
VGAQRRPRTRVSEPVVTAGSGLPARGACYGYQIRSELEFNYLRRGAGTPLEIAAGDLPVRPPGALLREWLPPLFPTHVRLHADGDGYRLWIDQAGWFGIEPHVPRITVPLDGDPVRREERIWGLPALLCFRARGDVPLHASCVEVDGQALLLAAPGRFGKTTLAAAFASAGYRILAEDLVCLRPGATPTVVPGPAMLRIRNDMVDSLTIEGAVELGRDDDRAHLSLHRDRGTCAPVPVAGIALLQMGDSDPVLERVSGADLVRDLWAVSFRLPTDEDRARSFRAVAELASTTQAWHLTRRLRIEDLRPSIECLVGTFKDSDGRTHRTGFDR